jgi:hypothetical protein
MLMRVCSALSRLLTTWSSEWGWNSVALCMQPVHDELTRAELYRMLYLLIDTCYQQGMTRP